MKDNDKAAYFAQYYGQEVHRSLESDGLVMVNPEYYNIGYLELKPLSSITDEDAYEVGALVNCWCKRERKMKFFQDDEMKEVHVGGGRMFAEAIGKEWGPGMSHPFANNSTDILAAFDFLRSRGYAMNFRNYSVEQLIEMGWLTLTSN